MPKISLISREQSGKVFRRKINRTDQIFVDQFSCAYSPKTPEKHAALWRYTVFGTLILPMCVPLGSFWIWTQPMSLSLAEPTLRMIPVSYVSINFNSGESTLSCYNLQQVLNANICSVWNNRKLLVTQWTTHGGRLGWSVNIEWLVAEAMCCAHLTIFAFVDMIYPLMAKILGRLTDHPDRSFSRPVDL